MRPSRPGSHFQVFTFPLLAAASPTVGNLDLGMASNFQGLYGSVKVVSIKIVSYVMFGAWWNVFYAPPSALAQSASQVSKSSVHSNPNSQTVKSYRPVESPFTGFQNMGAVISSGLVIHYQTWYASGTAPTGVVPGRIEYLTELADPVLD